jgi:hypothetical protein
MKAAAFQAHASNFQQILSVAIENAKVARLWRVGLADLGTLTDDERTRFLVLASSLFRFYEARACNGDMVSWTSSIGKIFFSRFPISEASREFGPIGAYASVGTPRSSGVGSSLCRWNNLGMNHCCPIADRRVGSKR